MATDIAEWLSLLLRWMHVIAAIMWIGSSVFFNWLDGHLERPSSHRERVEGELWIVHSGGFYQVEKQFPVSANVLDRLHWFKWEALFTWLTGILLLVVVYYLGGGALLVDPGGSVGVASGIGILSIILSWLLYDSLWVSRLGRGKFAILLSVVLLFGLDFWLTRSLSGRAAYIHLGAILGTLMVGNVWLRIIPAQKSLVSATRTEGAPDASLALEAKKRSKHNNYLTYPVVFIMISNHYPQTYGHSLNWAILFGLILLGAGVRHFMNIGKGSPKTLLLILGSIALALVWISCLKPPSGEEPSHEPSQSQVSPSVTSEVTGTLHGKVLFQGDRKNPKKVKFTTECRAVGTKEATLTSIGGTVPGVENAFVYVKEVPGHYPVPSEEVIIDQRGCLYSPKVVGVRVGQPVVFLNSDPLLHNVHALSNLGNGFNAAMPNKGMKITRRFTKSEIPLFTKCDVHPWMSVYLGVMDHPFFAVTNSEGAFEIKNVPKGIHTLEVWQEGLGKKTQTIQVEKTVHSPTMITFP